VQLSAEPSHVSAKVGDEAAQQAAWRADLHAFKHALATTEDVTPEAQAAKDAIHQAYIWKFLRETKHRFQCILARALC